MSKKQAIQELLNRKPSNTAKQQDSNTVIQDNNTISSDKKKATFLLSPDLHKELKIFAANQNKSMVEVVEEALRHHFKSQ